MTSPEFFTRVGQKNTSDESPSPLILLLASGNHERLETLLEREGYTVIVPSTADQAVAICLHNRIIAAILDEISLEEEDDWSLAQSLKMVSANTPVLLMISGDIDGRQTLPKGVDCAASGQNPERVLSTLKRRLDQIAEQKQAG
jgi:DNA-binding NtrC family response regulator